MRVLIVKVSALGDIVHALPVLPYLESAVPGVEIDWLVEEGFAPLLEGHPSIRQVHRLRTKAWRKEGTLRSLREIAGFSLRLRERRYDVALDLQGNSKSGLFTFLTGAPLRYGFSRDGVREGLNLLATNRRIALGPDLHHVSDRILAVAGSAFPGGERRLTGPLPVRPEALRATDDRLRDLGLSGKSIVVLHYGTTWQTKLWSVELWRALTLRLSRDPGLHVVLTWGNQEEKVAVEKIAGIAPEATTVWPRCTLPELAALLKRAVLVLGGDTGPIHMAAALGTPTLSLYRGSDSRYSGPRGEQHICVQSSMECSPCFIKGKKICPRDDVCSNLMSLDDLWIAVTRLLPARPATPVEDFF